MRRFTFDRAEAERSLTDPDGALWPVNAYTDADELDKLVQAALDSGVIARVDHRARLYIYPLSLSEPDPLLAVDPGRGPTLLGHSLKLIDHEGEDPVAFTLRLLEELAAEAVDLVAEVSDRPTVSVDRLHLRCPECCSEDAALVDRGTRMECGNCGAIFHPQQALVTVGEVEEGRPSHAATSEPRSATAPSQHADARTSWPAEVRVDRPEQLEELVRLAADAEIGLTVFDEPPCTCSPSRGCPQCFSRADALLGRAVRDEQGRQWEVSEVDEKDGFPTVGGEECWAFLHDVEVAQ